MATADLIAITYSGSPSCSIYDAAASTGVYGSSFGSSSSFAGAIRFDPLRRHFAFLHNGIGGGGYASDGACRLFRWNGTTWVRDAADVNGGARYYGVTWHRGDAILRPTLSANTAMQRYVLATSTLTSFSLPGTGFVSGLDVIGDVLYYYNGTAGIINRYDLASSSALSPLSTPSGLNDYDVRADGRVIFATSSSAYIYSASGALLSTHALPGTGTMRCIRWSKGDPTHYWVQRSAGVYEMDGSGTLVRTIATLGGGDQIDVFPADDAPLLAHTGAMTS